MKKSNLIITLICLIFSLNCLATVISHQWQNNYKGYSICQVPGTGPGTSNPEEFMAAGTVHDYNGIGSQGWHVMHLDATGSVLNSNIFWNQSLPEFPPGNWKFNVVDIVAVDIDNYWVTMRARSECSGSEVDQVLALKFDRITCLIIGLNPDEVVWVQYSGQEYYKNIYPTHSVYYNDCLYICGYVGHETEYPNEPLNNTSDKMGFILKCNVTVPVYNSFRFGNSPTYNYYVWNTITNDPFDYDMPLRMRVIEEQNVDKILLTGAANTWDYLGSPAGVLVMKYLPDLTPLGSNVFVPLSQAYSSEDGSLHGAYGVDIVGNGAYDQLYYILVNTFVEDYPIAWGIMSVLNTLTPPGSGTNAYVEVTNVQKMWANQFFYEENNILRIVGQQYDACTSAKSAIPGTGSGLSLVPAATDVNPFWAKMSVSYPMSGVSINGPTVHLSRYGTSVPSLDYLSGSTTTVGSSLEDVKRLYTFATQINDDPTKDIMMLNPLENSSNTLLNTKATLINTTGDETACDNQVNDCSELTLYPITAYMMGESGLGTIDDQFYPDCHSVTLANVLPTETDCLNNYYKQSPNPESQPQSMMLGTNGSSIFNNVHKIHSSVEIYPNPAKINDIIKIEYNIPKDGNVSLKVYNSIGQLVAQPFNDNKVEGARTIQWKASEYGLSTGIYFMHLTTPNGTTGHKISIY